jgi:hypothetical protein
MDYWKSRIGDKILAARLGENRQIKLACRCVLHAFYVNREFFAARVSAASFETMEALANEITAVANIRELRSAELDSFLDRIIPTEDSDETFVPGWVALYDAFVFLTCHQKDRDGQSLYDAIAQAFYSVELRGFMERPTTDITSERAGREWAVEGDSCCMAEIAFQLSELEQVKPIER